MALQAWGKDREKEKDQKWRGRGRRPELGGGEACGAVGLLSGGDGVQFRALEGDRVTERGASKSGSRAGEDWGGVVLGIPRDLLFTWGLGGEQGSVR